MLESFSDDEDLAVLLDEDVTELDDAGGLSAYTVIAPDSSTIK